MTYRSGILGHVARLSLVCSLLGCGAAGRDEPGPPGGGARDAGTIDLETYLDRNGVVRLVEQPDGTEYGEATTGPDGFARFYSYRHRVLFNLGAQTRDGEVPLAEQRVSLSVAERTAAYLVLDPTGTNAPLLHVLDVPTADTELVVDAYEQYARQHGLEDYDAARSADPFGSTRMAVVAPRAEPLTIPGLLASINVRNLMASLKVTVVANAFKYLIDRACVAVEPLYAERCQLVAKLVSAAIKVVGVIKLEGVLTWETGFEILDQALDLGEVGCDRLGKVLVGYVQSPTDSSARDAYRALVRKFNYLLHRMETDPRPGQPSWERAERMARALLTLGQLVRQASFQAWNRETFEEDKQLGFMLDMGVDAVGDFVGELEPLVRERVLHVLEVAIAHEVLGYLRLGRFAAVYRVRHYAYTRVVWESVRWSPAEEAEWSGSLRGFLAECALNLVKGAVLERLDGSGPPEARVQTPQILDGMLRAFETGLDELYRHVWGEAIPPPTMDECLPDELEPNGSWRLAVSAPLPISLGTGGVAELRELTLCDGLGGSGRDEDWYAYYIAPIEFRVQARLMRGPEGGPRRGESQPVCLDVYFYSQVYDIAESPPDRITGVCGTVGAEPSTEPFGVRRTIGEEWSMILLHVRPGPGASPTVPIDYGLRFIP
ncbi:MAG: hypothetical protein NZ898_08220 [Myxococcota bacterium]|nr:hypothetical protein [Myxococcota bacterium]MDW8361389.1 hypothetical protein [Myxococcales bacterium]